MGMKRYLGSMERALEQTNAAGPFNIVAALPLSNAPDPQAMEAAFRRAAARHPLFKMRLVNKRRKILLTDEGAEPIVFHVLNRDHAESWKDVARDALNRHLGKERSPPVEVSYLCDANGVADFLLCVRHTVMDGICIISFLDEMFKEVSDDPPNLQPLSLHPSANDLFPQSVKGIRPALGFVARQIGAEIAYRASSIGRKEIPTPPEGKTDFVELVLDKALVKAIARKARENRVTIYSTLCAAVLMAANEDAWQSRRGPLRLTSFHDLRSYLEPRVPRGIVGIYMAMGQSTLKLKKKTRIWDLARRVGQKVRTLGRSGDTLMMARLAVQITGPMVKYKMMRMGTVAFTINDGSRIKPTYGDVGVHGLRGIISSQDIAPPYSVVATYCMGVYRLNFFFMDTEFSNDHMKTVTSRVADLLREAVGENK